MREEILTEKPAKVECFIYNIDSARNEGTHWVLVFIKDKKCEYFDSYGFPPTIELLKYLNNIKERYYNTFKVQKPQEVICGHLCLYVLFCLSNNIPYYEILDELYKFSFL